MKGMESAARILGKKAYSMKNFVICINNDSNPASLIFGKVYFALPDKDAEALKIFRVIDEDRSESDGYLYPKSMFVPINVPDAAKRVLLNTIPRAGEMMTASADMPEQSRHFKMEHGEYINISCTWKG